MAKFEIEAKIGANSDEFKRKMLEAAAESREFAKIAKENFSQSKDIIGEVAGEAGLGKITSALAGAAGAAIVFGSSIIEACKKGIEAFGAFETSLLSLKLNLKDPSLAEPIMKDAEERAGAAGSLQSIAKSERALIEANILPEGERNIHESTPTNSSSLSMTTRGALRKQETGYSMEKVEEALENWSVKNGEPIEDMAEAIRKAHAGGAEGGMGMAKLLKSFKGLDLALQPQIDKSVSGSKYMVDHPGEHMPAAEAYKDKSINWNEILKAIVEGQPKGAVDQKKDTVEGKQQELAAKIDNLWKAIGEGEAPTLKKVLDELIEELPKLTKAAHELGGEFGRAVAFIDGLIGHKSPADQRKDDPSDPGNTSKGYAVMEDFGQPIDDFIGKAVQNGLHNLKAISDWNLKDVKTMFGNPHSGPWDNPNAGQLYGERNLVKSNIPLENSMNANFDRGQQNWEMQHPTDKYGGRTSDKFAGGATGEKVEPLLTTAVSHLHDIAENTKDGMDVR